MKKSFLLLILATAGFVAYQQGFLHPVRERLRRFTDKETAPTEVREVAPGAFGIAAPHATVPGAVGEPSQQQVSPHPPTETTGRFQVRCPACKGAGHYLLEGKGRMSRTQPCQVCASRGYRSIFVSPGGSVCPTCSGMGRRYEMLENGRMKSSACHQCVGRGTLGRR